MSEWRSDKPDAPLKREEFEDEDDILFEGACILILQARGRQLSTTCALLCDHHMTTHAPVACHPQRITT